MTTLTAAQTELLNFFERYPSWYTPNELAYPQYGLSIDAQEALGSLVSLGLLIKQPAMPLYKLNGG